MEVVGSSPTAPTILQQFRGSAPSTWVQVGSNLGPDWRVPASAVDPNVPYGFVYFVASLDTKPSSRSLAMSLVGAVPKKRPYSLLNCEGLK